MRTLILLMVSLAVARADVRHEPASPKPETDVTVIAKLPNAASAVLKLQVVRPGQYIRKTDPAYEKTWTDIAMTKAGDTFTAIVPKSYQTNRTLIRYRVVATDANTKTTQYPMNDEVPNYAWWCDAGPTEWSGSREPGKKANVTFPAKFFDTLQALNLIARGEDVAKSQWDGAGNRVKFFGSIVYRGIVYDHMQFTNRGQGSTHVSGKNKWGLKFPTSLPFRDHTGVAYPEGVHSLNLNPGLSTAYMPYLCGAGGLDEVLSLRAYRLAGVPTPAATWVQWRVIDAADEKGKTQYDTDLWGLYLAVGEMTPRLLAEPPLADGLTVSIQSGIKHIPNGMMDAEALWKGFEKVIRGSTTEAQWRQSLDLPRYFSFHAMNRLLGNTDLRPDGNHGYYRSPEGKWSPIPWDNDMMFVPRNHQPGYIDAVKCLEHSGIRREYRNRAREILDLFAADASPQGGQVGQLTHDLAATLAPKGFSVNWAQLDEAMWNTHPRMNNKNAFYLNPQNVGHFGGNWKRTLATADLAGYEKYFIDFCTDCRAKKNYAINDGDPMGYGWGYLMLEAKDDKIPKPPTVEKRGLEYVVKDVTGSVQWRVGRVGKPGWYELADHWRKDGGESVTIPNEVFKESGEYRVRARCMSADGRASHWSAAMTIFTK